MKPTLILPVAGRSRYPGMRPKWLLTHPRGTLMITEAIRGLNPSQFKNIVIIALESQELDYGFSKTISEELSEEYSLSNDIVKIVLLKRDTSSQSETVYEGIKQANISGKILIKDSDNYFSLPIIPEDNFVSVVNLEKSGPYILENKSYVKPKEHNVPLVKEIIEKKIVSNLFCCGGYSFKEAEEFCKYFEEMRHIKGLYISQIIQQMINEKHHFLIAEVDIFEDWGTQEDWTEFKNNHGTIFVELDGVIFLDSDKNFDPKWGSTEALRRNVMTLNKLYDSGKFEIILITSRSESYRHITIDQLHKNSVKYHRILFGLSADSKRIVISPFSENRSFPAATAINMKLDDDRLGELLR